MPTPQTLALRELLPRREAALAAGIYMRCRQRGYTPRSPHGCLVARIALEHQTPLLNDDRDF